MLRPTAWFAFGAISVACLGGPVAGAISGLFWPHTGGGSTESGAVSRIEAAIYVRHHEEGDYLSSSGPSGSSCQQDVRLHEFNIAVGRRNRDVEDLGSAIGREQARRKLAFSDVIAHRALEELPYPLLGALEGCIERSLLAPLCEADVHHIAQTARQSASNLITRQEARNEEEMNDVWCLVDRTFDHKK